MSAGEDGVRRYVLDWDEEDACGYMAEASAQDDHVAQYVLASDYDALLLRVEGLERVIKAHNDDCASRCGEGDQAGVACGYRAYFPRHCPQCPRYEMICDENGYRLDNHAPIHATPSAKEGM